MKVVVGLSLTLHYWIPLCRIASSAYYKHFNRTASRMRGCCCQPACEWRGSYL